MQRFFAVLLTFAALPGLADEGMWQPQQLPRLSGPLRALGLELEPRSMSHLTEFPMNAVISLGGCSASFVSADGLIVTNHHCAYGSLQYNSTEARNLLQERFLATSRADELPTSPGQRVHVLVESNDVTARISGGLPDELDPVERFRTIEDRRKVAIAGCETDPGHRCSIASFHGGLQYFLMKRLELRDVRLVYAPARSIGVFGGDVDNWMWPRHTGDFAFYRAYVGPDGAAADPAPHNVPYRPKSHLRVQPRGVVDAELVLVLGYPGSTQRYKLAREVENRFEWYYPNSRELLLADLETIAEQTAGRPDATIKYASAVAGLKNTTKHYQGMLDAYHAGDMLQRKRVREQALRQWIDADAGRRASYGGVFDELDRLLRRTEANQLRDLVLQRFERSSLPSAARRLYRLARERALPDAERKPGYQERDVQRIREQLTRIDRRFDPRVELATLTRALEQYRLLPADQRVAPLDEFLLLGADEDLQARLKGMFEATQLDELETRMAWIEADPLVFEASEDPFIRLAVTLYDDERRREREADRLDGELMRVRPKFMQAMIDFETSRGAAVYADANGTLRVTFGQVRGYSPRDGVTYTPFTRLEGIVEKYTGKEPFDSPIEQLELIKSRRYGDYTLEALHSVPVNFLSNVDTTGGSSGSPTINGRGELVGLLFDGTYDGLNGDWEFDPERSRAIHVDVRYMLWVMQYVDRAYGLLAELGITPAERGAGSGRGSGAVDAAGSATGAR